MPRFILIFLLLLLAPLAFAQEAVTQIRVYKMERRMELLDASGHVVRRYTIALGAEPRGHKTQEGDEKTPEGLYTISARNLKSRYHKSMRISYPNAQDQEQAKARGVSAGGDIMIHGIRNGFGWLGSWHRLYDRWTDGCIAVTNAEMDEIWDLVPEATVIDIRP
jgi:murein L,D-transpeptidase YafK